MNLKYFFYILFILQFYFLKIETLFSSFIYNDNYETLSIFLQNISMIYPSITKLISIGQSVQKRNIWALEITNKELETEQPKPAFKYIANVYGKEIIGRGICLYLIDYLCSNYGKKENITKLIDNTKIYIIPSLNPDGSELHQNTNANNVYLDEDFLIIPSTFDENYWNNTIPSEDYLKKRQPETQALMKFILQISNNTFIMGANLREGHLAITYPYNFNYYQIKNFLLNQRNVSFNNDYIKKQY
jgi:carboxypeptidase D